MIKKTIIFALITVAVAAPLSSTEKSSDEHVKKYENLKDDQKEGIKQIMKAITSRVVPVEKKKELAKIIVNAAPKEAKQKIETYLNRAIEAVESMKKLLSNVPPKVSVAVWKVFNMASDADVLTKHPELIEKADKEAEKTLTAEEKKIYDQVGKKIRGTFKAALPIHHL